MRCRVKATGHATKQYDSKEYDQHDTYHWNPIQCGKYNLYRRRRKRYRFWFRPPALVVRVTIDSNGASESTPYCVACVIVFTPMAEPREFSTIETCCLRSTGIVLLRIYIFTTRITPCAAMETSTGMTAFRLFAPMARVRTRAISACFQRVARFVAYTFVLNSTKVVDADTINV